MSDENRTDVDAEELERADGEALPDREAMSILPLPTDPIPLPVESATGPGTDVDGVQPPPRYDA